MSYIMKNNKKYGSYDELKSQINELNKNILHLNNVLYNTSTNTTQTYTIPEDGTYLIAIARASDTGSSKVDARIMKGFTFLLRCNNSPTVCGFKILTLNKNDVLTFTDSSGVSLSTIQSFNTNLFMRLI